VFADSHLEAQFENFYARSNTKPVSEGVAIVAAFAFLSAVVKASASSEGSDMGSFDYLWAVGVTLLCTFASVFVVMVKCSGKMEHLFSEHFMICATLAGLLAGGLSMWLGNHDPGAELKDNYRGRGYLAAYKLPVFLFGFSKLRLWQAWIVFAMIVVITQACLLITGRYFGVGPSLLFAFCTANIPKNVLSHSLTFLGVVFAQTTTCAFAEQRSRDDFLLAQNLVNESKTASTAAKGATVKLLSTAAHQVEPGMNLPSNNADEIKVEDEAKMCADLAKTLQQLSNEGINPYLTEFRSVEQEHVFLTSLVTACKWSVWRKHCGFFFLSVCSFVDYELNGDEGAGSQLLIAFCAVPVMVAVPANGSSRVVQLCVVSTFFTANLVFLEIWFLRLLDHPYFYAGVSPKTILVVYMAMFIIVYSMQVLSFMQKIFINVLSAAVFCIQAMILLPDAFYPEAGFVCPKCSRDWVTPDIRWGLEMRKADTIVLLFFFLSCGGLNAYRASMSQRRAFAGVQVKKAQTELDKARAKRLSERASILQSRSDTRASVDQKLVEHQGN
jgi:hypothetical protein